MQTVIELASGEGAARVLGELAAVIGRIEALEEAELAGDATAEAELDRLYGQMHRLAARISAVPPGSLSEALAMVGAGLGLAQYLRDNEGDEEGTIAARAHDLLTAGVRYLASALSASDATSVAPILRRYAGIG
jgi:hypothetical protein